MGKIIERIVREFNPIKDRTNNVPSGIFTINCVKSLIRGGIFGVAIGGVYSLMAGEESQSITDFLMVGATIDFLQYDIRGAIIPKFREEYNNYQDRIKRLVKKI